MHELNPLGDAETQRWMPAKRVGFRFLFTTLILFFFPFPSGLVNPGWLGGLFGKLWARVVPWFGGLIHVGIPSSTHGGSGDSTYDHLKIVCMIAIAVPATVIWSFLDRHRGDYRSLSAWSRIWMRYVLAVCMLTFGAVKVLMVQFEPPSYGRLIQPVGELSPMALLWTFMGFSSVYTSFTGIAEVTGGLLLFSRRTTTLGALVVAGIMANVVMLNISYDVPVKLGSLHILFLSLVLLAPDARRLLDFFVLNRPAQPADLGPHLARKGLSRLSHGVKAVLICSLLAYLSWDTITQYKEHIAKREKEPVPPDGSYRVESFKRDGMEPNKVALDPDDFRWKTFSLRQGIVGLRTEDGTLRRFEAEGDPFHGRILLYPVDDKMQRVEGAASVGWLQLILADAGRARLTGILNGHGIEAEIERRNASDMPLMSRGFHWISEAPYFHMFASDKSP